MVLLVCGICTGWCEKCTEVVQNVHSPKIIFIYYNYIFYINKEIMAHCCATTSFCGKGEKNFGGWFLLFRGFLPRACVARGGQYILRMSFNFLSRSRYCQYLRNADASRLLYSTWVLDIDSSPRRM